MSTALRPSATGTDDETRDAAAGPIAQADGAGRRAGWARHVTNLRRSRLSGRGRDAWLLAACIGVLTVLIKVAWPRFTWFGDNAESFFPMWHMVGAALREGRWLGFDPGGFSGGNVVGEGGYGLFNPVTLVNAVLVSGFDEMARASFVVATEFLILLGLGVRGVARAYGAHRAAAFTAGLIVPFCGFTLYYDAGNWISGLMSLTWVTWTWWAARRYSTGARGPLLVVVFGGLAVTVGYPYALLGVVVVLIGLAIELLRVRGHQRLGGLVVAGLCIGAIALLTYLPLIAAMPRGFRGGGVTVSNSNYLSPSIGDLLGLSSPTHLPEIDVWGRRIDVVPSVYLSWLVLPLVPWLRWHPTGGWRDRLGLLVPTGLFGLMALGPDQIWMFRWPLRLLEYSWVGLVVCFAVLLSAGLAEDHVGRRRGATAAIIGAGFFLAWSSTPSDFWTHLLWTAVVGGLVTGTLIAVRREGLRALPVMAVLGALIVTPAQAAVYGWDHHSVTHDIDLGQVSNLATVRAASAPYRGTVFQVSNLGTLTNPDAIASGRLTFGNVLAAAGHDTVNRYTGIGYGAFIRALSVDYHGSVMDGVMVRRMWKKVPGYDARVVDVFGIDTVVVGRGQFPAKAYRCPTDWRTVVKDDVRQVFQRREVPAAGPRFTPGRGVDVVAGQEEGLGARVSVRSAHGGTVLVNRLDWPGYSASTDDGRAVEVREGLYGLVELTVPPGSTVIHLDYEIPGLRTGLVAAALGLLGAAAHQLLWRRRFAAPGRPWRVRRNRTSAGG